MIAFIFFLHICYYFSVMENRQVHTIIVGGGITGLACAHFLQKKGGDFLLLEARERTGGFIQTVHEKGFVAECGPNTVLMNEDLEALLKELGLENDIVYPNAEIAGNRYTLDKGKLHKVPGSLPGLIFSRFFSLKGKIRGLKEMRIQPLSDEDMDLQTYLTKRFGSEVHDRLLAPVIRGIYAGDTSGLSAKYAIPSMWQMEKEYGSILKGLNKKKGSGPKRSIFTLKGGLQSLSDKISNESKSRIHCNATVTSISGDKDNYSVVTTGETYQCKHVILTCAADVTARLLGDIAFTKEAERISYAPVASLSLGFDNDQIAMKERGFGALKVPGNKEPFLGIIFNSHIFNHVAPKGKSLFKVMAGGTEDPELVQQTAEAILQKVIPAVKKVIQAKADPAWTEITQWKKGIPQYNTNHEQLLAAVNQVESKRQGIHILGNFVQGVAIGDCIKKAKNIANLIG